MNLDAGIYERVVYSRRPKRIRYEKNDKSVIVSVTEVGVVTNYLYGPSTHDEALRCSPKPGHIETGSIVKFDEYGVLSKTQEEARLDRYALQLTHGEASVGYIIVYDARFPASTGARERGERAKAYLNGKGVQADKLFLVDGGRREEMTVELFVTTPGAPPPKPTPTVPRG